MGKTVKRAVKRKAQGLANCVVDRAAGALANEPNEAWLIYRVCKEKECTYRLVNDLDVVEGYEVHLDNVAGIFYGCRVASDRIKGYDVHVVPNV